MLTQGDWPIAYGSCIFSNVETRYSQTECIYMWGMPFRVLTDHKPLGHYALRDGDYDYNQGSS